MYDLPDTRATLLARLHDRADQQAWDEFSRVYEPAVFRLARQRGLQEADAQDLTQEVLTAVAGAIHRWESDGRPGGFRAWLYTIARNLTVNALTRGARQRGSGDSAVWQMLHDVPDAGADTTGFLWEYRRQAFALAATEVEHEVQPSTWQAFWLSAIDGLTIAEVAARLKVSVGVVYAARSRILARLRQKVEELEGKDTVTR
jgi:RNA polymerase sigma-70 factor (ECF subfamily)